MSVWRDIMPAIGVAGGPAFGEKKGEKVDLHIGMWKDGRWSYLYGEDTQYGGEMPDLEAVREASKRARTGQLPEQVNGPMIKAPVWTWEVPVYFWFGGIAAGSSFVALACDLAGDEKSAAVARKVALGALAPSPALLIGDLGRPERFYNMLRIFKPRSPMSMGVWALTAFGNLAAAAVGADLLGRRRTARALGAVNAVVGGYLGSYTGVLLASTAVPVWARSRLFLGPIFVSTATATGAAACRLVLSATGVEPQHPTRVALANVETGAMAAELLLSTVNERRLGPLASGLEVGTPGRLFKAAKWAVRLGLAAQLARRRQPAFQHTASALYLTAGLLFRLAWVKAGPLSARDDRMVAKMARSRRHGD
jgi:polysulfide reductase-like protein